jgi:hypothetical protein
MNDWLELELAHHLGPTKAPDALWERVSGTLGTSPMVRMERPQRGYWLPVAAIVAVTIGLGAMWMYAKGQDPASDLQRLAWLELQASEPLDLSSSDPHEIADWARREAGVGLFLDPSNSTHLTGGRIIRYRGQRIAAVSYQVEGRAATMLVAHASAGRNTSHGRGAWQSGGQSYALAFSDAGRVEAACLICHSSL